MNNTMFKKSLSLFISIIMLFTMIPVAVFTSAATDDYPVMEAFDAASSTEFHAYWNSIYSATFLDSIDWNDINSSDTADFWDTSANNDNSVIAYIKRNAEQTAIAGTARYDLYIAGDGGVGANADSGYIFYGFSALEEVRGAENFKTANATTMCGMFYNCKKLRSITSINWDTSNVTDMSFMFRDCYELKELDLSSFDTSKVTTIRFMFYYCKKLRHIYVGNGWSTESIANLNDGVFNCCYAIIADMDINNEEDEKKAVEIYGTYAPFYPVSGEYATIGEGGYFTHESEKPQPEVKKYTVTYEFIGDEIPEGVTVPSKAVYEEGTTVNVEAKLSADGYEFSGWSSADADISSGTFTINNDVTIVGSWSKLYNVYYVYTGDVPAGAPALDSYSFKAGDAVTVDDIPFVDGYVFVGWETDDVVTADGKFVMPSEDVTLYGYFKKPVESVEINGGDIVLNKDGETVINVIVKPEDATIKEIIFESNDETVVKVDKNGKITAVGEGTAIITVYSKDDPSKKDTITVTVKIPVTDITVDKTEIILNKDATDTINAVVTPDDATNKKITYTSGDENIVTVDENGNITAKGEGTTTITVASEDDPTITKTVKVTVKIPVTEVTATDDFTLNIGEEKNVEASVNEDATNKELIYETSNPGVAKIDPDGNVFAVGEGTTIITVTSKDDPTKKDTVTVTVKIPVDGVVADKEDITLDVGDTDKITVSVTPDDATDKEVTFKSADESVATVDKDGNITAVGKGTTTITVTSKDDPTKKDTVTVTVNVPVDGVVADKEDITLDIGKTDKITVTVTPDNATDKEVEFKSNDESVVTVDKYGNITAVGKGTTTITVTSKDDPSKKDTVTVTVNVPVDGVVADKEDITLDVGKTDKITVTVTPDNATDKEVTFRSADESVATIDKYGNITAVGKGTTTITVTSKDDPTKKDIITVTVKAPEVYIPVTKITASDNFTLNIGAEKNVDASVNADATNKKLIYSSSDETVAAVDKNGKVTAVGEGTAVITITSADNSDITETVEVTVTIPEYTIVAPENITISLNETKNLGVTVIPSEGAPAIRYSSVDESIVKVDGDGNIIGVGIGTTSIIANLGNGNIKVITVTVTIPPVTVIHHVAFGKTDGIGWYDVSVNGSDFFPQGPNSTLEVENGSVLVIRVQDMWINDDFTFYVNGQKVEKDESNCITITVEGYMLIGALSMDVEVPDVQESLSLLQRIINFFKDLLAKIAEFFK